MRRRRGQPHQTKQVVIKMAHVDELVIPVVEYINHHEACRTLYSCQGEVQKKDGSTPDEDRPYVMWTCSDPVTLVQILAELSFSATTEVCWYQGELRYTTRFHSQNHMRGFIEEYGLDIG